MFCSACGTAIPAGQAVCPQCGHPAAPPVPPVPGMEFELARYRSNVKVLAIVWFVYAGLSLLLGFAGLSFARMFFMGHMGMWTHSPMPPEWLPIVMHFAWIAIVIRVLLAAVTGWGLLEHTGWGRILAIVVAILSLIKFPIGTALGIWTLVMLLGYRNSTLYEQL